MKSLTFFERLLGLSSPYSITKIEQDQADEKGVHIYIEVSKEYRPTNTNSVVGTRHDVEIRQWRHLDLFQYPCYIHCEVPKFKYGKGAVVPWARPNSGFTLLFEELVMNFVKLHGCVTRVAKQVKEYPQRVQTIINFYEPLEFIEEESEEEKELIPLEELLEEVEVQSTDLANVKKLNIDETSRKKGHDYVTNFLDGETGEILDIQQGKGAKVVEKFVKKGLSICLLLLFVVVRRILDKQRLVSINFM